MAAVFDPNLAFAYMERALWDNATGAYREAADPGWPFHLNDNFLARIIAIRYNPARVAPLTMFLRNPNGTPYFDTRWCLLMDSPELWGLFQHGDLNYVDWIALEAIYKSKARQPITATLAALRARDTTNSGWFTDPATPYNGHETYKSALSAVAFSIGGDSARVARCMSVVAGQQITLPGHPEYGGVLTDDRYFTDPPYHTWANVETTSLAIYASWKVAGGFKIPVWLPLVALGIVGGGAFLKFKGAGQGAPAQGEYERWT